MSAITQIHFDPAFPMFWIYGLCAAIIIASSVAVFVKRRGALLRIMIAALLILTLLNPSLLQKQREAIPDIAIIVIDESLSQDMGERAARTSAAKDYLTEALGREETLEFRIVTAPLQRSLAPETLLYKAIERAASDIPQNRRAGVVIVSDGQVHDAQSFLQNAQNFGPIHLLLTGDKNEKDRRIDLTQNPAYGIVGQEIEIRYTITQTDTIGGMFAQVTLNRFDGRPQVFDVPIGWEQKLRLPIDHAGDNIFELSVEAVPGEITTVNNRAAIRVNGVRDRLRVLLVSGKPHAGGRTWRDLLTSDPAVDLIHFTILREPNMIDRTPPRELSLIPFPFRELFEIKLNEFDLVIFDRYTLSRILPNFYFRNIANYVRNGGALLESSGPGFSERDSLYETAIGEILPGEPLGSVLNERFVPQITDLGQNHPVTEDLTPQNWGAWERQNAIGVREGDILMTGARDNPLLILNRVEEGRIAQLASDQIWLWARWFDGGGPHAELLRRTVHWLMKEPELDEQALKIDVIGENIRIRSRDPEAASLDVSMTTPDGEVSEITLTRGESGYLESSVSADQLGIYAFTDNNGQKKFVILGDQNPPELRDVLTSPEHLRPAISASGGGVIWLDDTPKPDIRHSAPGGRMAGQNWIGFRTNNAFNTLSVESKPLLPLWAWLALLGTSINGLWFWEGRR